MKYLYESHLGGYYVTDHELSLDERYCETCGDADRCIGGWDDDDDEEAAKAALIEMWEEDNG